MHLTEPDMAHSLQVRDNGVAGFVPATEIARPGLRAGGARMREALVPETCRSEFNPESSGSCVGHVRSELSRRIRIVAAPALVQVAT